ncbi:hypothetical protein NSK_002745 [Nannochloropsis salina CCMP1776]|uniref:Nudix hydrolase domain-containing protein n=1 Tax=Nannochloropsis salina CCMP1776 TaxID=1027361 RepID=A0A4D9D8W4_9STRA|nr:hypothetical protein NSK_002745 [Nannochloropsis salina CCMP1776]|eukprot:TFJ85925.1 hypothetical protein NSK_002745 [Nannochloropsis salina CCMP1776]
MTQEDFMRKDECLVVDDQDLLLRSENKYNCHRFTPEQPRGLLHRAFSVFLFDKTGRLLLQQRAASKITFPQVWTNTCCSHPLSGFTPTEVDMPEDLANGKVKGVKRAAIRKLQHELGIPSLQVPLRKFKFLTRLHYWAADAVTHGPAAEWGEHEIDYVLFIQVPTVTLRPNPDEVNSVKFVSLPELQEMMHPSSGLRWSPWFRIIAERFLPLWWADLKLTLRTNTYFDPTTIHRFEPPTDPTRNISPSEFTQDTAAPAPSGGLLPMGRASASATLPPAFGKGDEGKKQGAYGKIKSHSESLVSQLLRVDEVGAALRLKFARPFPETGVGHAGDADVRFCADMLGRVSRSFAAVIRQLPKGLCLETVVFYLVLRALDTVEDDMEAFQKDPCAKLRHLRGFYHVALEDPGFKMHGVGKGDEARLLENFDRVARVFQGLTPGMRTVIKDITRRMGAGMADFVDKDLGQGTVSLQEYDLYCHYVAGLVGEGLTRMFAESGLEAPDLATSRQELANSMGLFLQKTNIIRDYLEDFVDGRAFWPQEVWKRHAPSAVPAQSLGAFAEAEHRERALACLDELVTNALEHVPDCLAYMSRLHTPQVFRFCAIPQVMAIATLEKVYHNPDVFTGVVKIRKGLACKLILEANSMEDLYACFSSFAGRIARRAAALEKRGDSVSAQTLQVCEEIRVLCKEGEASSTNTKKYARALHAAFAALLLAMALVPVLALWGTESSRGGFFARPIESPAGLSRADYVQMAFNVLVSLVATLALSYVVSKVWRPLGGQGNKTRSLAA